MKAQHLTLETDQAGKLKGVPPFPPNKQVEMYVMFKDKNDKIKQIVRKPHPDIIGKIKVKGNIIHSVPENDWNLPE
ncbi:hypothetical protein [Desulfonatronovibrio magnus]|uniref:hypothetical protein n=1 Tax=Desulfonatronovibrio magnus TaxID=698827 RepID=UPI0005EB5B0A|nr:hypothetical protein [Desulfonatronovibrio magnus]